MLKRKKKMMILMMLDKNLIIKSKYYKKEKLNQNHNKIQMHKMKTADKLKL